MTSLLIQRATPPTTKDLTKKLHHEKEGLLVWYETLRPKSDFLPSRPHCSAIRDIQVTETRLPLTSGRDFVDFGKMGKSEGGPPPQAPPSYFQATGGVPPASPFTPGPVPGTHHAHQAQQRGPTIVTTVVPVGPHPTHMICPSCHAEMDSATETKPGPIAYISGILIALFGCWCGCCLIPCCIDECMDVHHTCPNCKAYLGRFRR